MSKPKLLKATFFPATDSEFEFVTLEFDNGKSAEIDSFSKRNFWRNDYIYAGWPELIEKPIVIDGERVFLTGLLFSPEAARLLIERFEPYLDGKIELKEKIVLFDSLQK